MKPYINMTKRLAKKRIGKRWKKIQYGLTLKPGDLISSCKGYNEKIKKIEPFWSNYRLSKGWYICDFDIETESGSCCSLVSCCSLKLETKEEILAYYKVEDIKEWMEQAEKNGWRISKVYIGISEGKDVFDEDGQPYFEFAEEYEQRARFPERFVN